MKRFLVILWLLLLPALLMSQTSTETDLVGPVLSMSQTSTMTIVLAWDPNTEADLAGYHVYWGNAPGVYGVFKATIGVMTSPTYTTPVLPNGSYYFVVTAFNNAGLESGFSNEVSAIIASAPAAPTNLKKKVGSSMTWGHKATITLANTGLGLTGDLSGYPIVFLGDAHLATEANGGYCKSANGYDIRFTSDSDGNTVLPYELVLGTYNATTGVGEWWIKLSTLDYDASQLIYVWAGNADISIDQTSTATWNTNFKGVWHLPNGTTLTANDSTANENNGTLSGTTPPSATSAGQIDGAGSFDGSSGYVNVGTNSSLDITGAKTISGWAKATDSVAGNDHVFSHEGPWLGYGFNLSYHGYYHRYYMDLIYGGVAEKGYQTPDGSIMPSTWHYVVVTHDLTNVIFYLDGSAVSTQGWTSNSQSSSDFATIGASYDHTNGLNNFFYGLLDETRVSSTALSADWIKADYVIQNNPTGYYSVGTWADVGGGETITVDKWHPAIVQPYQIKNEVIPY